MCYGAGKVTYTFGPNGARAVYTMDLMTGVANGLTSFTDSRRGDERDPAWSADCQHVVYAAQRPGELDYDLWVHSAGRDGLMRTADDPPDYRLVDINGVERAPEVGRGQLTFAAFGGDHGTDPEILWLPLNTDDGLLETDPAKLKALTSNPASDFDSSFSPDGSEIAYRSNRAGNNEIFRLGVCPASPCDATPIQLTTNGADDGQPTWSPNGREIVFSSTRAGGDRDLFTLDPVSPDAEGSVSLLVGGEDADAGEDEPAWAR